MLSALDRAGELGASDVYLWMTSVTPQALMRWYNVKIGMADQDPPTWAMRLGSVVGDLILDEYARHIGFDITRRQERVPSPHNKRIISTLDGFLVEQRTVLEAKFASPYMSREDLFARYYCQCAMQMHCCDVDTALLIIAQGTNDPIEIECVRDATYERELLARSDAMLLCIDSLTPPVTLPVPVPPEKWRSVDLKIEQPNWAAELQAALVSFDETADAAKAHDEWGKRARELVPDDVGRVLADPFVIARNKKGTLAITRRTP